MIVNIYVTVRLTKNPHAKSSLADPIHDPKANECLVNFVIQTLHIGQCCDLNNFNTLHWGHVSIGLYKYGRYLIAYLVLNYDYYKFIAPAPLSAVNA